MKAVYFLLAYFFYFLGDLCSKISTELFFVLYQRFMNLSLDFDSKCGYKIWKLPQKNNLQKM
jgi:hypothetical protein